MKQNITMWVLLLMTCAPIIVSCDCCHTVTAARRCADGTGGTPCCGYGKCNIFCCNCDGGCRRKRAGTGRTLYVSNYPSVSATLDDNGDGLIDENEAYRKLGEIYTPSFDFFKYDVNGDGQLSFDEMSNVE